LTFLSKLSKLVLLAGHTVLLEEVTSSLGGLWIPHNFTMVNNHMSWLVLRTIYVAHI